MLQTSCFALLLVCMLVCLFVCLFVFSFHFRYSQSPKYYILRFRVPVGVEIHKRLCEFDECDTS